jgi:hypothetical protein
MDSVLIPCPKCGKELKLRDRGLLGKTGKCPKCEFRFVLQEPEEVELELADGDVPVVGTSPRWIPDDAPAGHAAVATPPAPSVPLICTEEPAAVASSRWHAAKKQRKQQWKLAAIVGGVSALLLGGLLIWANSSMREATSNGRGKSAATTIHADAEPGIDDALVANTLPMPPPRGQPITLTAIPLGARVIIHLRPAELWKDGSNGETVRLCLGPLGVWAEKKLKGLLLFEPSQIEEAVICLYLDDKTQPPEIAYSVKLTAEQKPSTFLEKFGGKPDTVDGHKVYKSDAVGTKPATAYMITDRIGKGFAACPAYRAGEMVAALTNPGLPGGGLEQLLKRTDDKRHVTILFEPFDLGDRRQDLFPEDLHGVLGRFLDRFESNRIESVAWSFYFGSKQYPDFYSELWLRNKTTGSPSRLKTNMARKLDDLPGQLGELIRRMTPRIVAERKLVSRLPVMMEAFRVETVYTVGSENERFIKLTTALPDVAGPNLAAASMLTWRLASVTEFSKPKPKQPTGPKLPALVADRLKLKVDVDFRKRPLQGAIDDIAEGISVKADIDGDALKDAGYTKNMEQNMKLGMVPAKQVLYDIFKKYPGMVLVVDEKKKMILVTTEKFAKMKGQKPFPLKP